MSDHLLLPLCLLGGLALTAVPAWLWERRKARKAPVVRLPDRSNVVRLQRRNGATVVRIDSGRGRSA